MRGKYLDVDEGMLRQDITRRFMWTPDADAQDREYH
jgi:hypothetical protein